MSGTGEIVVARPTTPTIEKRDGRSIISTVIDKIRGFLIAGGSALDPMIGINYYGGGSNQWGWSQGAGGTTVQVNESSLMGLPPFGRGVDLIASAIAGVDLQAWRYDPDQGIDVQLAPGPALLRDPDPLSTPWHWKYALVNDLIVYGNHFAFLGEPNAEGWPQWTVPIDATLVALARDRETGQLAWRVGDQIVAWGSLFHCPAGNRSGKILGRGVLTQYRDSAAGIIATDRHARQYFESGGLPSAVIIGKDPDVSQTQAQQLKDRYRATIGAGSREPMVLSSRWEFKEVVSDAEKQQLVEARKFDATLVAMILGLDPHYLGLPGSSQVYQNIEQADIAFVRDTVSRWANPFEAAVSKWLLPAGQSARFAWSDRMRTDRKTRAETIRAEVDAKILTPEEGRREVNRPAMPVLNDNDPSPEVAAA